MQVGTGDLCVALHTGLYFSTRRAKYSCLLQSSVGFVWYCGGCAEKSYNDSKSAGGKQCQGKKEGKNEFIQVTVTVL